MTEVLVIGGGLAGLTAAVRCAEHGLSVALLEAGADDRYLCNSRLAMGFFNVAFRDIHEGPAVMRQAVEQVTGGEADPDLVATLVDNVGPALAWLRRHGVRVVKGNWRPGMASMLVPPAAIGAGLRWHGRGPDQLLRRLEALLVARGGRLVRGTRACELLMQGRRCTGVLAEQGGRTEAFAASAVVIADGGFQADPDLLRRYVTAHPERLLTRNAGTGRGDGLRMALAAGARLSDMRRFYGHVQSADALGNARLWPYPTLDHAVCAGIAVDRAGRRFTDEGRGGVAVANAIARRPDPLGTLAVFDHAIWMTRATEFPLPANPLLVTVGATMHRAATLDGLATAAGLAAEALAETVRAHNRAVDAGETAQLDPPRTPHPYRPLPIRQPPFYAVPLVAGITYTMGGIAIDGFCRVRHRDGGVLDGLYAAGSATGGHEGGPHAGYTGGLSKALTFGWHAGNTIAAARRTEQAA